jgi:uncharacterized protein (DUF433 family)
MSGSVVTASTDVMSGTPVFPGARVPVQTLLEYLEAGDSIDEFLVGFASVSRSQVVALLERATTLAVTPLQSPSRRMRRFSLDGTH